MQSVRKIMVRKAGRFGLVVAVLLTLSWPGSPTLADDYPPDFMVIRDWKDMLKKEESCSNCVRVGAIQVLGKEARGNQAEVLIEMRGDWVGLRDCRSVSGPCKGFSKSNGISQKVRKTLIYRRYDSRWELVTYH